METTTRDLKAELKKSLELLRALSDEIRVQLHLGGMEAKRRWDELQPRLDAAERAAREATDASRVAIEQTVDALKELRGTLKK